MLIKPATILDCLRHQAQQQPDLAVFSFLQDGQAAAQSLTFAQLDALSDAGATQLLQNGWQGQHALLLYPSGLDFILAFFACLKAGVTAIPMPLARKEAQWRRIAVVQETVAVSAVLFADPALSSDAARYLPAQQALVMNLETVNKVTKVDTSSAGRSAEPALPLIKPEQLAFLQFTSGSTGRPKGVQITHANIMANEAAIAAAFGSSPASIGVGWLPMFHDMGLIGNVLQPVYAGFPITLLAPASVLQRPLFWLETIARVRATMSGGPNFIYRLCAERAAQAVLPPLDLSAWKIAFCGAERIDPETVQAFSARFAAHGFAAGAFFPCYGLAEATLFVSGGPAGRAPRMARLDRASLALGQAKAASAQAHSVNLAGCGLVAQDQVKIVDVNSAEAQFCAPGVIGEIWIRGPSVAAAYANAPEASAAVFGRFAADGSGPWLASGDHGFIDQDGELFVSGRSKELIIINGRNYYPQDLEQEACAAAPELDPAACAAIGVQNAQGEGVVLVAELRRSARHADLNQLQATIRSAIAGFDISLQDCVLVKIGSLPKTSSGKLERRNIAALYAQGQLQSLQEAAPAAPKVEPAVMDSNQAQALQLLSTLLAVPAAHLSLQASANALGMNSLQMYQFSFVLEQELGLQLDPARLFEDTPLALLLQQAQQVQPGTETVQGAATFPLSETQLALWLEQQQHPQAAIFTLCFPMQLQQQVDPARMQSALDQLMQAHPLLNANVEVQGGEPQWRMNQRQACLQVRDAQALSAAELAQAIEELGKLVLRLDCDPLLQVHVLRRAGHDVLVLICHHIVADAWSLQQFAADFVSVYQGREGQKLAAAHSYASFVAWHQEYLASSQAQQARAYWRQELAEPVSRLNWPRRHTPPKTDFSSQRLHFHLPLQISQALNQVASRHQASLFEVLLSIYALNLSLWSGETHFSVALPMLGRPSSAFSRVQGYCVQLAVLRFDLQQTHDFAGLLRATSAKVRAALQHQWYPQIRIGQEVAENHFQTLFTMHDFLHGVDYAGILAGLPGRQGHIGEWQVTSLPTMPNQRREEMAWSIVCLEDGLALNVDFQNAHFSADDIGKMVEIWRAMLERLCSAGDLQKLSLAALCTLPREDWSMQEIAPCAADDNTGRDWLAKIAHMAQHTPQAQETALVYGAQSFSYRQLWQWAQQVAHSLQQQGVKPGARVALLLPRQSGLIAAMLGTLLAGAAYIPLDLNYPPARTCYVMEHAQPQVLLTLPGVAYELPANNPPQVLYLPDFAPDFVPDVEMSDAAPIFPAWQAQQVALIIYTSGSTGRPKGVAIRYEALAHLHAWALHSFPAGAWRGVAATTSICFDLSVYEIFSTLYAGGCIYLYENALSLLDAAHDTRLKLINTVPSACRELLDTSGLPPALEVMNLAGEPLPLALAEDMARSFPQVALHNLYGPTEDTTYSTHASLSQRSLRKMPIGKVLPGGQAWVMNSFGVPVPRGVSGELYLGGAGLAQGYLFAPAMTAERFVPHPFAGGARLYRTGDLVRLNAADELELFGRCDHQVKLRGFRIETGEIAEVLQSMEGVSAAAVLLKTPPQVRYAQLVAYVAAAPGLHQDQVRAWLAMHLPPYMLPSEIFLLPQLPLTPNGKIDRLALADIKLEKEAASVPQNRDEEILLRLWQSLLQRDDIGTEDDFFMAGGHSMLVMRMVREINLQFGMNLEPGAIFEQRTIRDLARHLQRLQAVQQLQPLQNPAAQSEMIMEAFEI